MQNYQITRTEDSYMISSRGHVLKLRASDRAIVGYDADYATAVAMRDAVADKLDRLDIKPGISADALSAAE